MSLVHTNKVNTTNNEVKAFKSNYVMVENDKYIFIDKEIIQVLEMARKRIERRVLRHLFRTSSFKRNIRNNLKHY